MSDLFKTNENEFYIELKEQKYYFPGDHIIGNVVLDLKKQTKTNNIKLTLEGTAEMGGRTATLYSQSVLIAEPPMGKKHHTLEPRTHRFPFKFIVPEKKLPSTLKIPKLLKVKYKIMAVHIRPYMIMDKLCSTATETITILEKINVEADKYQGVYSETRELNVNNENKKAKVIAVLEKRAIVKGDTIPIIVTIHHNGVTTRKNGVHVQLLRYVYYGKNKNEVFGPKILSETSADIDFPNADSTKSFRLNLTTPKKTLCPTAENSCDFFKIEYNVKVKINLNEENRFKMNRSTDIAHFDMPIVIGTFPKYEVSIEDDDVEEELISQKTDDSSEYSQVFEKMKELDLGSAPITPTSLEPEPTPLSLQFQKPNEYCDDEVYNKPNEHSDESPITKPNEYTDDPPFTKPNEHSKEPVIKPNEHSAEPIIKPERYLDHQPIAPLSHMLKPLPRLQKTTASGYRHSTNTSVGYSPKAQNTFTKVPENMSCVNPCVTIISPTLDQFTERASTKHEVYMGLPLQQSTSSIQTVAPKKRISLAPPPVPPAMSVTSGTLISPPATPAFAAPPLPPRRPTLQHKPLPKPSPPPLPSRPAGFTSAPVLPTMNNLSYPQQGRLPLQPSLSQPSLTVHHHHHHLPASPPVTHLQPYQGYDPSHYHPFQNIQPHYNHSTQQSPAPHGSHAPHAPYAAYASYGSVSKRSNSTYN
ncbi:hypothetical protein BY458DRAFT_515510 [Sporodiniella umbellata]|nr:hypothetical protein BY458DRAFT_515510 [Sporodiniella umbellata]